MNELNIQQIDYRYILVDNYKSLGLNEYDLAILLLIDNTLKKENILITPELLALKMNLAVTDIDALLASLSARGFIEYVSKNETLVTSLNPLFNKITTLVKEDILKMHEDNSNKEMREELSNVYLLVQKELERSLSPIEFEKVRDWINQGIKEDVILECIHECQNKHKRVTINQIDKAILKYISSRDIEKEGYSSVNEKWKKDLEDTIKIANVKWTSEDD